MNLNELAKNTNSFIAQARSTQGTIAADNAATQDTLKSVEADQTHLGDLNSQLEAIKAAIELKTTKAKADAVGTYGMDLTAQNEVITALVKRASESDANLERLGAQITEKSSVGLLDNPISWFFNQFSLDSLKEQFASEKEMNVVAHREIQNRQAEASNQATIQANLVSTVTPEQTALLQEKAATAGALAAKAARLEAIKANSTAALQTLTVSNQALNELYSLKSAQNQEAQLQISRANLQLSREQFENHKKEFQIALEDRQQAREEKRQEKEKTTKSFEQTRDIINAGRAMLGQPPLEDSSIDLAVRSIATQGEKSVFYQAYNQGMRSLNAGGKAAYSDSPGEYLDIVSSPGFTTKPTGPKAIVHDMIMNEAVAKINEMAKQPPGKDNPYSGLSYKKDPEAYKAAVSSLTMGIIKQKMARVDPSSSNPFNVGPLADIINQSPEAQKLPIVQKLFAERTKQGDTLDNPARTFQAVVDGFKKGELTTQDLIDFSALYKRAAQTNAQVKDFHAFGIDIPPAMIKYNVELETHPNSVFGNKKVVDLTDANAVKKAVIAASASRLDNALNLNSIWTPLIGNPITAGIGVAGKIMSKKE